MLVKTFFIGIVALTVVWVGYMELSWFFIPAVLFGYLIGWIVRGDSVDD